MTDDRQLRGVLSAEDFRTPEPPAVPEYTRADFDRFAALYMRHELNPRDTGARVELQFEMRHGWRLSAPRMHRALLALDVAALTADTLRARAALTADTVAVAAVRMLRLEFHPDGAAFVLSERAWSRVAGDGRRHFPPAAPDVRTPARRRAGRIGSRASRQTVIDGGVNSV